MLRYLFCVLLAPVAIIAASPAQTLAKDARDENTAESVTLSVRGVNFRDPGQAKAFYARLETVAHEVCDGPPNSDPWAVAANAECRERALDDAVLHLNRDTLNAVRSEDVAAKSANPALHARR